MLIRTTPKDRANIRKGIQEYVPGSTRLPPAKGDRTMAVKKTSSVRVEFNFRDKENEDRWIEATVFRTEKKEGGSLVVTSFAPNIGREPLLDIMSEMEEMLDQTKEKLLEYRNAEKALGKVKTLPEASKSINIG